MKQRILAVDDEPHMVRLLERIISQKTPYQIETTSNSLEVPQILENAHFDLIISDLKMPGMDGLDILRWVRERERDEEVMIITAFGSMESAIEALSQGCVDYITKPFKKEQIICRVNRIMHQQNMKRESQRIAGIFEEEPYEQALKRFQQEYIRRLAARCDSDETAMVDRSGLSAEVIRAVARQTQST